MPPPSKVAPIKKATCVGSANPQKSGHRFASNDLGLLETGEFSDVQIVCGDRTWKCHQIIIANRCAWFKTALTGSFVEAQTRVIKLMGLDTDLVDTMIRYIYSGGDLDISKLDPAKNGSVFSSYSRVWILADYFLLEPLRKDAIEGLKRCCGDKLKMIADLKAPMGLEEQKALVKELADGVGTAFHGHPSSATCQRILVDYAFCCRGRFLTFDKFIDLVDREYKFGRKVLIKCLREREAPCTGAPGTTYSASKTTMMDPRCKRCREPQAKTQKCFHDSDTSSTSRNTVKQTIVWVCDKCVHIYGYPWEAMHSWKES